jgi:gamma-glutamylcyclotransferase (GGCT)/AIG2-like uncharacterized protein YtfP
MSDFEALLFSYGTLQNEEVQLANFGRRLEGTADSLPLYKLTVIEIRNPEFVVLSRSAMHRNVQFTGSEFDSVEGTVLKLTKAELERADAYEQGAEYQRILVTLNSGRRAWVYLRNPH